MPFSAVLFDMDGLMFDTERLTHRAWARAMADFGQPASFDLFLRCVGTSEAGTNAILSAALGAAFPVAALRERERAYVRKIIAEEGLPVKPGLLALLAALDDWKLPRAVASSSHRATIERNLARAELTQHFHTWAGGDEVAQGKPAPDVFLLAAQRLGVSPQHCLVLEDSENGVRAAVAAGCTVINVPDLKPLPVDAAALTAAILPDLVAVRDWLEETRHA